MSPTSVDTYRDPDANRCSIGVHLFKISGFEEVPGQQAPQWKFTMVCQDKEPDKGKTMITWLSLSEAARWKIDQFFTAVEAPNKKGTSVTGDMFVGRMIRAVCEDVENAGNIQRKVTTFLTTNQQVSKKLQASLDAQIEYNRKVAAGEAVKSTAGRLPGAPLDITSNPLPATGAAKKAPF